jgi:hypothetical protein
MKYSNSKIVDMEIEEFKFLIEKTTKSKYL